MQNNTKQVTCVQSFNTVTSYSNKRFFPRKLQWFCKGSVGKLRVSLRQEVSNCEAYIRHVFKGLFNYYAN